VFRWIWSGVPWNEAAKRLYGGAGSFGNEAAMRVAPAGVFCQSIRILRVHSIVYDHE